MVFCYYKKIAFAIIISLFISLFYFKNTFAERVLWPSAMNLYNDSIRFNELVPENATSSNSKKGFLFTGDVNEVFTLGAGHIGINLTLAGKGHVFDQLIEGLKKRGIKITIILINENPPVGTNTKKAPKELQNPYCYMIDFSAVNGEWQKFNFNRIVDDYGKYADNWVIGNEINSQVYNFYGEADIETYTKKYCDSFKICYDIIKRANPKADVYMSFDQGWDLPSYNKESKYYNKKENKYRYNTKEQLKLINKYLDKNVDWGVALHPYPAPVDDGKFWDDEYAGFDEKAINEKERPYLLTLKNFEIAIQYLANEEFLKKDGTLRNIAITEFAMASKNGEDIQAAGLYYLWEKIKDNDIVKFLLYNAQTDLPDGFHFGLSSSDKLKRKRLIWAVFKDMDREDEAVWCKDLLHNVLNRYDYVDYDGAIWSIASFSELKKINPSLRDVIIS